MYNWSRHGHRESHNGLSSSGIVRRLPLPSYLIADVFHGLLVAKEQLMKPLAACWRLSDDRGKIRAALRVEKRSCHIDLGITCC